MSDSNVDCLSLLSETEEEEFYAEEATENDLQNDEDDSASFQTCPEIVMIEYYIHL